MGSSLGQRREMGQHRETGNRRVRLGYRLVQSHHQQ